MKQYIKGQFTRSIFSSDNGYVIGLLKVRETNDDEMQDYINKTITFTGYFAVSPFSFFSLSISSSFVGLIACR